MANTLPSTIDLVNLDPDLNKSSLIAYLQSQSRFKDYDFTGSDIQILLDMLSINTFRHAFFTNMAISEMFIDSAQVSSDVRSNAKDLGYTPRSITSSIANITVSFNATGESQPYTIPKGSTFSTSVKNKNFTFSTTETIIVASPNNTFTFTANVSEGIYVKDSYVFNGALSNSQPFTLTNQSADTNSLVVNVFEDNSTVGQNFNLVKSLLGLNSNSYVFFLQCSAANGNFEVLFGDGIFGYQPQNGALVVLDYLVSQGDLSNGSASFGINFDPTGIGELNGPVNIVTNQSAVGGAPIEDIETTRFYAPRWFQTQERAVIESDYEILLKQQFPEINAVNAYGGETLTPPQFGKIILAVNILNVNGLPSSKVAQYTTFLKGRNILSIQPIWVAATFMYIQINSIVRYNINVTTETNSRIASVVASAINTYNDQNLNNFNVTFRLQPFTTYTANSDPSIVSMPTTIQLYQKINPSQVAANYYLNYAVPLISNISRLPTSHSANADKTLSSSNFYYKGNLSQLEDDGAGTVRIVNITGNTFTTAANTGTINYSTGIVNLNGFAVDSYSGDNLLVFVVPQDEDITSIQNTILAIEPSQTNITVQQLSL